MAVEWFACLLILVAALLLYLVKIYFAGGVCTSTKRIDGKTVIITGANTGIGKETAVELAKRGARVIIACRDETRGQTAVKEVVQRSRNTDVLFKKLDLASLSSIRAFADDILRTENRLDILVNNAGVGALWRSRTTTEDGFEQIIGVNHLGHFLLTNLLLDLLQKSSPSRVINVASNVHTRARGMNFSDINSEKQYNNLLIYGQSKLANILFSRELARRMEGSGVTAYSLHPGVVRTDLWREFPFIKVVKFLLFPLIFLLMKSPQQGAQTSLHVALADVERFNGMYFADCTVAKPSKAAQDDGAAKKLWEISAEMVGL